MGREGGVVSSAVLHVQHQSDIQNLGLEIRVGAVGTEGVENVLRSGKLRVGLVDVQPLP